MYRDPQEPTFTVKAKDVLAVPTIRAYHNECVEHGRMGQAEEVYKALQEMIEWQEDHAVKFPDHKHLPHPLSRTEQEKAKAVKKATEERERQNK